MVLSSFIKLFSLWFCVSLVTAEHCVKRSSCSCVFPNGTGIDLTPSASASYYTSDNVQEIMGNTKVISTYYFHPCSDVRMPTKPGVVQNTCDLLGSASICRHMKSWIKASSDGMRNNGESYDHIGSVNETQFALDGSYITYFNGPASTIVHLVCAEMDDKITVKDVSDPARVELRFFSRNACRRQLVPGQSQDFLNRTPTPPPLICEDYSHGPKGKRGELGAHGFPGQKGIQASSGFPGRKGDKGETGQK